MDLELSTNEARVIGCLLEKESTTPDQYPLTLNSLVSACNQKSNREPVLALSSGQVQQTLNKLIEQRLISEDSGARATRYRHRFCNTNFSNLQFSEQERAIVCVLLLRGAQTPGELRSRTGRMTKFNDVRETESVLQDMINNKFAMQLPREAGRRESRYAHLFSGDIDLALIITEPAASADKSYVEQLEQEVIQLKAQVQKLEAELALKA